MREEEEEEGGGGGGEWGVLPSSSIPFLMTLCVTNGSVKDSSHTTSTT